MLIELLLLAVGLPIFGYLLNKFYFSGGRCTSTNRLDGKVAIITGANTGIGYETALDFARRGAKVIMACRDLKKAEEAANKIKLETGNEKVSVEHLDLVDLESVKKFADSINKSQARLDLLINNAGIMMCPLWRTKQGFEMQFGVNHLAHFYLTYLLIDLIKRTPNSRIINVSSRAHYDFGVNWNDINWEKSYNPIKAYGQSKSANVLFSKELAKRLKGTGVFTASLHPGAVRTELLRYVGDGIHSIVPMLIKLAHPVFLVLFKSSYEGAQTTIHCAVADGLEKYNGFYFSDCKPKKPREHARRDDYAVKLWDISCKMVGINWE